MLRIISTLFILLSTLMTAFSQHSMEVALSNPFSHASKDKHQLFIDLQIEGLQRPTPRLPVNLAVIVDNSTYVTQENLTTVKNELLAQMSRLDKRDKFCVIEANGYPQITVPSEQLRDTAAVRDKIESIKRRKDLNMEDALKKAFEEIRKGLGQFNVHRIIVIGTGNPNKGARTTNTSLGVDVNIRPGGRDLVVSSILVGPGDKSPIYQHIAEAGDGKFHHAIDTKEIRESIRAEMDQVLNVSQSRVHLRLTYNKNELEVKDSYTQPFLELENGLEMRIGQIAQGEKRRILFRFGWKLSATEPLEIGVALVYDRPMFSNGPVIESKKLNITYTKQREEYFQAYNDDVLRRAILLKSVSDLDGAIRQTEARNNAEAIRTLARAIDELEVEFARVAPDEAMMEHYELMKDFLLDLKRERISRDTGGAFLIGLKKRNYLLRRQ